MSPPGENSAPATRSGPDYPALELALFAFICFLPSLAAGFVYDDLLLIQDNRYAHGIQYLGRAFTHYFWQLDERGSGGLHYYRPLVTVTYVLDWIAAGGKPWFFHFFNVAVHAATTYLVVLVARRWTGRDVLAVAVALLFILHPSRTESVIWIAGRTDVLMTFFMLLSVELSFRASRVQARRARLLAVSAVSFVLALLCKEAAAMLPLLLLVDVTIPDNPSERRSLVPGLVVQSLMAAVYVVLRVFLFPVWPSRVTQITPRYGLLTVFAYAERTLWPWPQTFFHRPLYIEGGDYVYPLPLLVAGGAIILAYTALTVVTLRKDRPGAFLLLAAAAAFGPLLNFTYTGIFVTTSDHFLYLPLLLFLVAIARIFRDRLSGWARTRVARVAFGALLFAYATVCTARSLDYKDQEAIYAHEFRINPHNPLVLKSLSENRAREGRTDEALDFLLAASRPESTKYALLVPVWLQYQNYFRMLDLQVARTADGNVQDLRALYAELNALLRGQPPPFVGHIGKLAVGQRLSAEERAHSLQNGAGQLLAAETALLASRLGDDARARELLQSLDIEEDLDTLPNAQNVALTYARLGDFRAARRWLDALAVRLPTRYPEGAIAPERHRFDRAETLFAQGARANPGEAQFLRAQAFLELGAFLRGLLELRPVFDEHPTSPGIGSLYVNLLVASGLEEEARAVAERALGPDRGRALVQQIRDDLPLRVRKLRKPHEPSPWYTPATGNP